MRKQIENLEDEVTHLHAQKTSPLPEHGTRQDGVRHDTSAAVRHCTKPIWYWKIQQRQGGKKKR
jgi:hypothetical protein